MARSWWPVTSDHPGTHHHSRVPWPDPEHWPHPPVIVHYWIRYSFDAHALARCLQNLRDTRRHVRDWLLHTAHVDYLVYLYQLNSNSFENIFMSQLTTNWRWNKKFLVDYKWLITEVEWLTQLTQLTSRIKYCGGTTHFWNANLSDHFSYLAPDFVSETVGKSLVKQHNFVKLNPSVNSLKALSRGWRVIVDLHWRVCLFSFLWVLFWKQWYLRRTDDFVYNIFTVIFLRQIHFAKSWEKILCSTSCDETVWASLEECN